MKRPGVPVFGLAFVALALAACGGDNHATSPPGPSHSAPMAISPDGARLYVVHPDADSVTILDAHARTIVQEILLSGAHPAPDTTTGRYDPAVAPRALALDATGGTLYVTGQRSGQLYAINTASGTIRTAVSVGAEPIGVVVSADSSQVFVACSQDDQVVALDATTLAIVGTVPTPRKPWGLAFAPDGKTLLATHLLGPGVTALATNPLALSETWSVPDRGPEVDPTEPHGQVRGIYDAVARPGTQEIWVAHLMLGTDTPQPTLAFNMTVFPALSILDGSGTELARLSVSDSTASPGDNGAFGDIVSGPRALAFSDDGKYAFVADTDSEDLLVVDATQRVEAQIVRPLPGHLPEGVVWHDGEIYVQERNSEDVAAFEVEETTGGVSITADGAPFASLTADPMPPDLRLGQKLFYSANSDDVPTTQNHWVACATCHLEGRSDAVTWLFAQGPRDTPTNAGGTLDTGFLFRTADRTQVQDYWKTIDVEQGGAFNIHNAAQVPLLDALADFVNYAIPTPIPPTTDPTLVAQGETVFNQVGCATCHSGPAKTDSGTGNTALAMGDAAQAAGNTALAMSDAAQALGGTLVSTATPDGVLLHDVGTCVTSGPWPDVVHDDIDGDPRPACAFDTPALRGLVDSAPYLHDGSAATLDDAVTVMLRATVPAGTAPPTLSASDGQALVEYLRSL
jgi:YVTN family beta-propeller protein